jgi:methylamine dehydrogenase accessory protein MauD
VLRSLRAGEAGLDVILASDGEQAEHLAFYKREKLAPFPYVLSPALGMTFRISKLPYAVLIGPDGKIAAKGLVNTREQIESLLVAHEMGVASLQDFVSRDTQQGNGAQGGERIRNAVV